MLISPAKIIHDIPLQGLSARDDEVETILMAIRSGAGPIVAVHPEKFVRTKLLTRLVAALREENARVIRTISLDGETIDLICLMDQIIGETCTDPTARTERCFDKLTLPEDAEATIALVVEDAHLATDQSLCYLSLVGSFGKSGGVPLHIILVGNYDIWERLPSTGSLSADQGALRVALSHDPDQPDCSSHEPFGHIATERVDDLIVVETTTSQVAETADPPSAPQHQAVEDDAEDWSPGQRVTVDQEPADFVESHLAVTGEETAATEDLSAIEEPVAMVQNVSVEDAIDVEDILVSDEDPAREADPASQPAISIASQQPAEVNVIANRPPGLAKPPSIRRRRLTLAVCVGAAVTGGGLAVDRLISTQFPDLGLIQSIPADPAIVSADQSNPTVLSSPMESLTAAAAPPQALAGPEIAQPATSNTSMTASVPVQPSGEAEPPAHPDEQAMARPTAEPTRSSDNERSVTAPPLPANQPPAPEVTATVEPHIALPPAATAPVAVSLASPQVTAADPIPPRPTDVAPLLPAVSTPPASTASADAPDKAVTAAADTPDLSNHTVPTAAGSVTASPSISPALAAILIERGDGLLMTGDITGARLMYQRAAASGAARGAVALGMTYDPVFLVRIGARGIAPDPQRAVSWYRRAADLGSAEALRLVAQLQPVAAK